MIIVGDAANFGRIEGFVWLSLLHGVWIGLLVGSLARLAVSILPTSSHWARRSLAVAGLAAIAIGSPAAATIQGLGDRGEGSSEPLQVVAPSRPVAATAPKQPSTPAPPMRVPAPHPVAARVAWRRNAMDSATRILRSARPYAMALWAAGVVSLGGMLVAGACRLRRLSREADPSEGWQSRVRVLSRLLRMRRPPAVGVHPDVAEPCLVGVFRPVILLPTAWLERAGADEAEAVLAHELAHARRLDHLANLAQRLVEAGFCFHPCVHWLSRLARREAEHAADALAARVTGDPLALARALERAARFRSIASRPIAFGLAVGGDRPTLLPRVQELLGMKPPRPRFALWPLAALPAAVLGALVAGSVSQAEEAMTQAQIVLSRLVLEGKLPFEADPKIQTFPVSGPMPMITAWQKPPLPREKEWMINASPGTLKDEELASLIRHLRPSVDDPSRLPRKELLKLAEVEQVWFEIRYLEALDDDWNRLTRGKLAPDDAGDPGRSSWLVDRGSMVALLRGAREATGFRALRGGFASSPEEYPVILSVGADGPADDRLLNALRTEAKPDIQARLVGPIEAQAIRPDGKVAFIDALKAALYIQFSAIARPKGLAVSVRTAGLPYIERVRGEHDDQAPAPVARRVDVEVPEHATLIVDPGFDMTVLGPGASDRGRLRTFIAITPRLVPREEWPPLPPIPPQRAHGEIL